MLQVLKSHPFAVEAEFENVLVLTFAFPKEFLQKKIPSCLELDVYQNQWAFIAVAMVQTRNLRPKGFPKSFGSDFFLTGYRIFVRYTNNKGKKLRGLYILKSETDSISMSLLGNVFTHYNYTVTDISCFTNLNTKTVQSEKSHFKVVIDTTEGQKTIPLGSPFKEWKDARRFSGPLPFTFSLNNRNDVVIIEGVRNEWKPRPVSVLSQHFYFFADNELLSPVLAAAFEINNVPYYWKKGVTEKQS